MTTREVFADQAYARNEGGIDGVDVALAAGEDLLRVRLPRAHIEALPADECVRIEAFLSLPGRPFVPLGHAGLTGGVVEARAGPMTESFATWWVPGRGQDGRRLRFVLKTTRALRTSVLADTHDDLGRHAPRLGAPPRSVAIDSSGFVAEAGGVATISGNITVANQADRRLFGYVCQNCFENNPKTVSTFTFNGDALTLGVQNLSGNNVQQDVYHLLDPDVATGSLSVTFTATVGSTAILGYITVYGAGDIGTYVTADHTNAASVTFGGYTDGIGIAFHCACGSTPMTNAVTDGTERWEREANTCAASCATEDGNSGGHTIAFSSTGSDMNSGAIGVGVAPAAAASGGGGLGAKKEMHYRRLRAA